MPEENKLPEHIENALGYSRNYATAKPNIGNTEKEHILGLANLLEKTALEAEALHKDAERNKRMLLDACVSIGSIGEALGLDMDADADTMIGTARDLIEGLNRIIKECPLGSQGFAIACEVLGELGVQQEVQP